MGRWRVVREASDPIASHQSVGGSREPDFSGHRASRNTRIFASAFIRFSRASSRIDHAILAALHAPRALAASLPAFSITRPRGSRERLKTDRSAKWGARVGIFAGTAAGRTRRGRLGRAGGRGGGHERPGVYLGVGEVRGELSHGKKSLRDEAKDERRADWRSATGEARAKLEIHFRARS